jgi:hypothetical protein
MRFQKAYNFLKMIYKRGLLRQGITANSGNSIIEKDKKKTLFCTRSLKIDKKACDKNQVLKRVQFSLLSRILTNDITL